MSFSSTKSEIRPELLLKRHSIQNPWTYSSLDQLQRKIAQRVKFGGPGALILSDLSPVITLGKRESGTDILLPREYLSSQGVEIHSTDRGGLATYHGPGQWVLFAVDSLERLTGDSRGVRQAVEALLHIALVLGLQYDSTSEIRAGAETGVWTEKGKFASVGVYIENRVLLHGLSVNGFRTPLSFLGIRPCGLAPRLDFLLDGEDELRFTEMGRRLLDLALKNFWPAHHGALDAESL